MPSRKLPQFGARSTLARFRGHGYSGGDAGRYAEAADRGRELIEAHPEQGYLYYNVACCESLAGRETDAIEHLRQAIGMWEGCRDMANADSDFDPE